MSRRNAKREFLISQLKFANYPIEAKERVPFGPTYANSSKKVETIGGSLLQEALKFVV